MTTRPLKHYRIEYRGRSTETESEGRLEALEWWAQDRHEAGHLDFHVEVRLFEDGVDCGEWFVTCYLEPRYRVRPKIKLETGT